MPYNGPETVVAPPPLAAPPTGLLQSVVVIEHAMLQTTGNLAYLVGPDAPDTMLASVIESTAGEMFEVGEYACEKLIDSLSHEQHEKLRSEVARRLTAAAMGGMELGGDGGPDPLDHWVAGITWRPEPHLIPELVDPCTNASVPLLGGFDPNEDGSISRKAPVKGQSFLAVLHDSCSTWGWQTNDYVGRAQRGLAPREGFVVEREFMHGVLMGEGGSAGGHNRFLSDSHCHVYDTGSVDPKPLQALAYANEVIARSAIGQGMIHVSAFFVEVASALGYTFQKDSRGRLVTLNGNIVVPGNGYDGVGPDATGGSADDSTHDSGHTHEWIYISDVPVMWRAPAADVFPATLREATNRALNEVTFRTERPYVIEWSALLQVAIKVNVLG